MNKVGHGGRRRVMRRKRSEEEHSAKRVAEMD